MPDRPAAPKIDEILVQLLKRESERKELLDPGDRERARRPLAAERRGPRALYVGMVFGWQEVSCQPAFIVTLKCSASSQPADRH